MSPHGPTNSHSIGEKGKRLQQWSYMAVPSGTVSLLWLSLWREYEFVEWQQKTHWDWVPSSLKLSGYPTCETCLLLAIRCSIARVLTGLFVLPTCRKGRYKVVVWSTLIPALQCVGKNNIRPVRTHIIEHHNGWLIDFFPAFAFVSDLMMVSWAKHFLFLLTFSVTSYMWVNYVFVQLASFWSSISD